MHPQPAGRDRVPTLLVAIGALYFAEGFPFGLVTELFPLYLRSRGVGLEEIGMLSAVGLAWTLKFLWAPVVDRIGTYRSWIRGCLLVIAALLVVLGDLELASMRAFWIISTLLCLASATQDIAIDALAIDRSTPRTVGLVNSMRIASYRIAIIAAGGGLALVAEAQGWRPAFFVASGIAILALLPTALIGESPRARSGEPLVSGLRGWLARPEAPMIVAFALLYKIGDSALTPMVKPFWVDSGYPVGEIGTATTTIGIGFTIVGGIVGGLYITKLGLVRSLLHLGVIQMATNAGYALAAALGATRPLMYVAAVLENFASGLGTAAFLSLLMTVCEKRRAATEFALLSALYGFSRTLAGSASGFGAEAMGYTWYFTLTLALGIPGLVVVFMNRDRITRLSLDSGKLA
jgi:MFS transporter, PAT family, beta-lactamase induction signal transducer AmpG